MATGSGIGIGIGSGNLAQLNGGSPINRLGVMALAQLLHIAIEEGVPILEDQVLAQAKHILDAETPGVLKNDKDHGWSATNVGDPKNDYPGDPTAKRIDNFFYLYGKALPGKFTDLLRDFLSRTYTPGLRAEVTEETPPEVLAKRVYDVIYAEAYRMVHSIPTAGLP